jgi:hypothetical protein
MAICLVGELGGTNSLLAGWDIEEMNTWSFLRVGLWNGCITIFDESDGDSSCCDPSTVASEAGLASSSSTEFMTTVQPGGNGQ